jgi:uroporphyrin-III C-methyltransferase
MKRAAGKVYIVGAGPGAADLITVRGAVILGRADIVFHDALVPPAILALAERAEKVAVGKRCGRFVTAQQFISKRLVDAARKHRVVVRLKGGDPMLFGRAHEEITALRAAGVAHEVVPGVTAALAASAEAGISLTQRGAARSVAFVTARVGEGEPPSEWARNAAAADTAVIYMGAAQAEHVAAALIAAGAPRSLPVLVVENASLPDSRSFALTLDELPRITQHGLTGPAVIMLGRVFAAARAATEPASAPACKTA